MEDFAVGVLAFREAPLLRLPGERIPFGFARFAFIWLSFYHYVIEHLLFQSPAVKDAPKPCAICLAAKSHLLPIEGGRSCFRNVRYQPSGFTLQERTNTRSLTMTNQMPMKRWSPIPARMRRPLALCIIFRISSENPFLAFIEG